MNDFEKKMWTDGGIQVRAAGGRWRRQLKIELDRELSDLWSILHWEWQGINQVKVMYELLCKIPTSREVSDPVFLSERIVRHWHTEKLARKEVLNCEGKRPNAGKRNVEISALIYPCLVVFLHPKCASVLWVRVNQATTHRALISLCHITRGSAIAEEPRDALRQLKYYGRIFTELLTRSSANPEEPCEHTISWNRVKCCTNVRRIACEKSATGEWPSRSFKVTAVATIW